MTMGPSFQSRRSSLDGHAGAALAMKRLTLILAATLSGLSAAQAAGWPLYPVHIERQHRSTLVIEHTPVAPVVAVRHLHRGKLVVRKHRVHRVRSVRRAAL